MPYGINLRIVKQVSIFLKMFKQTVKDNKQITKLVLWFDSCISENNNSIISLVLQ